jgi:hypothetical protein
MDGDRVGHALVDDEEGVMRMPGARLFHVKPGGWVQCDRFLGTFNAPAVAYQSCSVHDSIPFSSDDIGLTRKIFLEQGIHGHASLDSFLNEESMIIRPKKIDMPMSCSHDGVAMRCFL